jgi:acetolactate synthase regulatory subunit
MPRYLIIANQTLGGSELSSELEARIAQGGAQFHVVVPMTEPQLESPWVPADPLFGIPAPTADTTEAIEEARRRSEVRLERILELIRRRGGEASGEVGTTDPVEAARSALDRFTPDHVIVSTLPSGISRWLKMDLPSRIERLVDVPVTTVEASPTEDTSPA